MLQVSCVMLCRQQQIVASQLHTQQTRKFMQMTCSRTLQPPCLMRCNFYCACRDGPGCQQWACWLSNYALPELFLLMVAKPELSPAVSSHNGSCSANCTWVLMWSCVQRGTENHSAWPLMKEDRGAIFEERL